MRLLGPLAALLVVACTSSSETAAGVVERFYATAIAQKVTGAPTAAQLATLAPFLSDTLRVLLEAARRRSEADAARAPDEKPRFVEGDLFSSLFEGPNAVDVVADSARGDARVATVRMSATSANPPVTWTDRVVLVKRAGRFVIDDIEYAGTWDFANKGGLRTSLVSGLATRP